RRLRSRGPLALALGRGGGEARALARAGPAAAPRAGGGRGPGRRARGRGRGVPARRGHGQRAPARRGRRPRRPPPRARPRAGGAAGGERVVIAALSPVPEPRPDPVAEVAAARGLTKAEAAVLACLGEGLSNKAIAERLFVSIETVKTHVQRILAKLGVASR